MHVLVMTMRRICIINQKGGVGKTTTTVSLAKGLADRGQKVLVIDFDPQGNVSNCLPVKGGLDVYSFLVDHKNFDECVHEVEKNLHVMPSCETLTKAELILAGEQAREMYLKRELGSLDGYDFVLIDCPPSLGLLNQNALLYADEAIIPTSTDALGLDALQKMLTAIDTINDVFGHELKVTAIVPTMHDARLKQCKHVLADIQNRYYAHVTPPIRTNSKLREAPKSGKSIFDYAKSSKGAKDYNSVIDFILEQQTTPLTAAEMIAQKA